MTAPVSAVPAPTAAEIAETIYRLDGPLRWALGEVDDLLRSAGVRPGMVVVDIGTGTGYAAIPAAHAVGPTGTVHCIDAERRLLDVLEDKAGRSGLADRLRPHVGDATSLPLPDSCADLAVCTYLLHELAGATAAALAEIHRVLRPTGKLIVADYRKTSDSAHNRQIEAWYARQPDGAGPDERHLRYTLSDMEELLRAAGFRHLTITTWLDFHLHAVAVK